MCGIAGIFDITLTRGTSSGEIEDMVRPIYHRGPDASGVFVNGERRVGLGSTRLSILDRRPESNQPFFIEDGGLGIVYNGEIYNYIELRQELERLGVKFRTDSDTEVALRAYRQWGEGALGRFNGMFALAVYDPAEDKLFCARDRLGVKPFNYVLHEGRFYFASEIKSILAVAPELAVPDYDSLSRLLRASVGAQSESSCFENIRRLRPAHCMTVSSGGVSIRRWWDFPIDCERALPFEDAAEGLRHLLSSATKLRMRSDVPVGLTLSSGLDSSSIAATVRSFFDGPFDVFTASYEGEPYDESGRAKEFAESIGMTSWIVPAMAGSFLETLRGIVWHLESPTHSPAVFPLWNIAREAAEKVTVLLDGQGADEVIGGYSQDSFFAVLDRLSNFRFASAASEIRWAVKTLGPKGAALLAGRTLGTTSLHRAYRILRGDERVYNGPLREAVEQEAAEERDLPRNGFLNGSLIRQIEGGLVNLLHYGDAISMAHSIETRNPFLDYRVVEYCVRLPGHYKVRDGRGKAVLREAMRGLLPDSIVLPREKLGFPTPIAKWFREKPEETIYPVLRSNACVSRGLFEPRALERAIEKHVSGRADLSNNIFRWILTELWFERFID
jgi:asparagine synthase (glutamine-hydrolysing)